jgi:chemotaxis response regulator CheB
MARPQPGSRGRVLLVEDDVLNQIVAVGILGRLGYHADVAENGREAVAAAERGAYRAVLMDCRMPETDGYQATAETRRREGAGHHVPVIAMRDVDRFKAYNDTLGHHAGDEALQAVAAKVKRKSGPATASTATGARSSCWSSPSRSPRPHGSRSTASGRRSSSSASHTRPRRRAGRGPAWTPVATWGRGCRRGSGVGETARRGVRRRPPAPR